MYTGSESVPCSDCCLVLLLFDSIIHLVGNLKLFVIISTRFSVCRRMVHGRWQRTIGRRDTLSDTASSECCSDREGHLADATRLQYRQIIRRISRQCGVCANMIEVLRRRFRSFLDRLYVLQRFKLFLGPRIFPCSTALLPQHLRRQLVDLVRFKKCSHLLDARDAAPWSLDVRRSCIPHAGLGVFLEGSSAPPHTLFTLYPGNVKTQTFSSSK